MSAESGESASGSGGEAGDAPSAGNGGDLLRSVQEQAGRAASSVESFAIHVVLDYQATLQTTGEQSGFRSENWMEAVLAPAPVFKMTAAAGTDSDAEGFAMTMILTEDAVFMQDPSGGPWLEWPKGLASAGWTQAEGYKPSVQLEDLEPYLEWLSAEETADGYVLRLSGGGDTFEALARDLFRQRNFGEGSEEARDAGDMAVHRLECEYLFDKKTHFIKSIRLYMELTLSAPEGDYAGTFDLRGEYSRINEIPGIPLPEDTVSVDLGF